MANFCPIITLRIEHNYFSDGLCTGLTFTPTNITKTLMQQHQLLMLQDNNGMTLLADTDFSAAVDQDLILRFSVFSADPAFGFYTEQVSKPDAPPLFYSTQKAGDSAVLGAEIFYTPESLIEGRPVQKLRSIARPCFILDLHVSEILSNAIANKTSAHLISYAIQLTAPAIYWKYYFFGDLTNFELEIQDLAQQDRIIFDPCDENVVKNGKAFISQSPIVMSHAPKQKFQLKDKNNSGKVLVKRLPNAALHLLGKQRNPDGQHVLVAEIYVNQ